MTVALTEEQVKDLDRDGYIAPLYLCSAPRIAELRAAVEAGLQTPGPYHGDPWAARHQDCQVVYDICASPEICDAVAQVLGPDLVVWNSVLMNKAQGDGEIPWHQDHDFDYLKPDIGLAVWLAIDDANVANGCLEVIPGSHRDLLPSIPRSKKGEFDSHIDMSHVAGRKPVPIELRAGEFLLFWNKILHHSAPNLSPQRRLGLAIRYTVPAVKVDASKFFDGYRTVEVCTAGS
jgi:chlorinating enzyme